MSHAVAAEASPASTPRQQLLPHRICSSMIVVAVVVAANCSAVAVAVVAAAVVAAVAAAFAADAVGCVRD